MIHLKSYKSLLKVLGVTSDELKPILDDIESYYSEHSIPKKDGTTRLVVSPHLPLKKIQKKILKLLLRVPVHRCAHGGVKKRSHLTNANCHIHQKMVYCLDIKTFYPSISSKRIRTLFEECLGCSPKNSVILTELTTRNFALATGAPTSAALANIVCGPLDAKLYRLARSEHLNYTRFIDDMTFSGESITREFQEKAKSIIRKFGLTIHPDKEVLLTPQQEMIVTGINVNKSRVKISRDFKRNLRAEIHRYNQRRDHLTVSKRDAARARISGKKNYIETVQNFSLSSDSS